ncbi:MAG: hypothetical protein HUK00_04715 [Bacteroidaceae bacterium]|nr:hypothetical protein [Bacteroidaceae bacterium]
MDTQMNENGKRLAYTAPSTSLARIQLGMPIVASQARTPVVEPSTTSITVNRQDCASFNSSSATSSFEALGGDWY